MEHRPKLSTAIQSCQYDAKAATTILKLKEPSKTGHNHHAASKSRQNSKNQSTGQAKTIHYLLKPSIGIEHLTEPSRAI